MNIAIATTEFVTENNFDGGLANYTYKLAKWLLSQKNRVTVFLMDEATKTETKTFFEDIPVVKVPMEDVRWQYKYKFEKYRLGFLMNKKKYYRVYFEVLSKNVNATILRHNLTEKFDIVHYPNNGGMVFDCPKNIPNIVRLSGLTVKSHELGGYGNSDMSIFEQEKFEMEGIRKASAVVCPSKMTIEITRQMVDRKYHLIETPYIQPVVKLDDTVYQQHLAGKKYVLFFGSICLIKGIGTIADMIFDLLEQNPDLNFAFVGKKVGNQVNGIPLWDYLIKKAGCHSNRIIHISSLKHHQLFPVIQHAECVVLPSRIDNFPNTCIEAMANGKIVIGTIGNGFDQLIEDGKNGFVVKVDDSQALLETVNKVLSLPGSEKRKMEEAAKKRTDLLHPDIVLNQLLDLYKLTIQNFKN